MEQLAQHAVEDPSTISQEITDKAGKYLIFRIAEENYGIDILKVQEIIQIQDITTVPRMPDFVRGVLNLRGKVIPVMNLRKRFGMEDIPDTDRTSIIVAKLASSYGSITMGIIVDSVSEVIDIPVNVIEDVPDFGVGVDTTFILGMGKIDKKVIILLDIDKILTTKELNTISETPDED